MTQQNWRVALLMIVAVALVVGILALSIQTLPDPPASPTPTFSFAIDFPEDRRPPGR